MVLYWILKKIVYEDSGIELELNTEITLNTIELIEIKRSYMRKCCMDKLLYQLLNQSEVKRLEWEYYGWSSWTWLPFF